MDFFLFLEASIKLGIPMIILSWIIFAWLYGGGDLDRESDRKSVGQQVKSMKKSFKRKKDGGATDYIVAKWMWFGSGFYGLAGLWTFVVIEIADLIRLILNPSTILESLDDGLLSAIIDLAMNQFSNLIAAFVWFGYWGDDGIITWFFVAYVGYWIGVELARRGQELPIQELVQKLKSLLPSRQ